MKFHFETQWLLCQSRNAWQFTFVSRTQFNFSILVRCYRLSINHESRVPLRWISLFEHEAWARVALKNTNLAFNYEDMRDLVLASKFASSNETALFPGISVRYSFLRVQSAYKRSCPAAIKRFQLRFNVSRLLFVFPATLLRESFEFQNFYTKNRKLRKQVIISLTSQTSFNSSLNLIFTIYIVNEIFINEDLFLILNCDSYTWFHNFNVLYYDNIFYISIFILLFIVDFN